MLKWVVNGRCAEVATQLGLSGINAALDLLYQTLTVILIVGIKEYLVAL